MQYLELNALHDELGSSGLVILGFPCNQFGLQEPGSNEEIPLGLKYVRPGGGFEPKFQMFEKGDINGKKEQKVYTFLKNSCPPVGNNIGNPLNRLFWDSLKTNDVKWNFEKFLVGPDGRPWRRWHPRTPVAQVKRDIIFLMKPQHGQQSILMLGREQK
ncbi:glutathione peroxidase 3 [Pelobates cultripes]|uniref:Glutathione peroxidase n=1 Tax=Pelobates cultripes TaxID=61616 RepID=A0AAD1RQ54_PELCU|nr:glutathione peroxidase 3 [Pelobates cultripes]